MLFILSKLLFLLKPLVWSMTLFAIALFSKRAIIKKRFLWSGFIVLFLFSNDFIIGKIFNAYEPAYPKLEKYDVGILLGGFSGINPVNKKPKINERGDRLFQTIALYKQGTITQILISGGNGSLEDTTNDEADIAREYLLKIGIPDSAILVENRSRNTIENAAFSYNLLKKVKPHAKILVITSAWHIPRAKLIFSKTFNRTIAYYPTNQLGKTGYGWSDFIVPSSSALNDWELLIKEWVGLLVDRFRVN
jgi:uncharacterized SAM-binding protein YcdF (DUF218 family)